MKKAETNKQDKIDEFFKTAKPLKKIDYEKLTKTIKKINK